MGLHVMVFRTDALGSTDFTLGGISAEATQLTVVNASGPSDPSESCPAALLVEGAYPGTVVLVPAENVGTDEQPEWKKIDGWLMAGGNYAATSDGRFGAAIEQITGHRFYGAVNIHDRHETAEQTARLSV